jgi:uncharacterized protein YndB with AHSA1/START domain
MAESRNETAPQAAVGQAVRVTRTIRASRHRVYRAWTEPELLMRWFIEEDGEMWVRELDLRAGGRYALEGRVGDKPWRIEGKFLEVSPPRRLIYSWSWDNDPALGEPVGADTIVTVEFIDRGTETEVVVTHEGFATEQARAEHNAGWIGCLDKLDGFLEKAEDM